MADLQAYQPGDRVRSNREFAQLFPQILFCNGGRAMTGTILECKKKSVVLHWDGRVHEVEIDHALIEPETTN